MAIDHIRQPGVKRTCVRVGQTAYRSRTTLTRLCAQPDNVRPRPRQVTLFGILILGSAVALIYLGARERRAPAAAS